MLTCIRARYQINTTSSCGFILSDTPDDEQVRYSLRITIQKMPSLVWSWFVPNIRTACRNNSQQTIRGKIHSASSEIENDLRFCSWEAQALRCDKIGRTCVSIHGDAVPDSEIKAYTNSYWFCEAWELRRIRCCFLFLFFDYIWHAGRRG